MNDDDTFGPPPPPPPGMCVDCRTAPATTSLDTCGACLHAALKAAREAEFAAPRRRYGSAYRGRRE